jgi:acetylornithine/succinyldiaminopimelate/putrescine aminotransferase
MQALLEENMFSNVAQKEALFHQLLQHKSIHSVSSFGLWMAVAFDSFEQCKKIIDRCIDNGVFTDWFLFASNCMRISPPLTISTEEIEAACKVILAAIDE